VASPCCNPSIPAAKSGRSARLDSSSKRSIIKAVLPPPGVPVNTVIGITALLLVLPQNHV
ncbi:hypothetical protein C5H21_13925, partial [Xylella fastidiosa]